MKQVLFHLILAAILNACALGDLTPAGGGFPPYQSEGLGYPQLLEESAYDFHDNPQIP